MSPERFVKGESERTVGPARRHGLPMSQAAH